MCSRSKSSQTVRRSSLPHRRPLRLQRRIGIGQSSVRIDGSDHSREEDGKVIIILDSKFTRNYRKSTFCSGVVLLKHNPFSTEILSLNSLGKKISVMNGILFLKHSTISEKNICRTLVVHQTVYDKMQTKYPEFKNLIGEMRWNVSNEIVGLTFH